MACTICGEEGHNSRTCSKKDKMIKNEEKREVVFAYSDYKKKLAKSKILTIYR